MKLLAIIAAATAVKIQSESKLPVTQMANEFITHCDSNNDGAISGEEMNACLTAQGVPASVKDTMEEVFLKNGKIPTTTFIRVAREHMGKKQAAALFALANTDNSPTAITVKELEAAQPRSGYTEQQLQSWFEDDVVIGRRGLRRAIRELASMYGH